MSTLLELAERCEKATGPDRQLDWRIWIVVHAPDAKLEGNGSDRPWQVRLGGSPLGGGKIINCEGYVTRAIEYSASLDAAMTLAEGTVVFYMSDIGADGLPMAKVGDPSTTPTGEWTGIATTLPLALCAAALRARAANAHPSEPRS